MDNKAIRDKRIKNTVFVFIIIITVVILYCCNKTDSEYKKQWYLENRGDLTSVSQAKYFRGSRTMIKGVDINIKKFWHVSSKIKDVHYTKVAIVDTGIDYSHSELSGKIWTNRKEISNDGIDNDMNGYIDDIHGWNFVNENNRISSYRYSPYENSHGTAIAGIIAAKKNGKKVQGIVNSNMMGIISLKVLGDVGGKINSGTINDLISAIEYAEKNGAEICNLSINTNIHNKKLEKVIKHSRMLFVVSAGNHQPKGKNIDYSKSYPASCNFENVITVASMNYDGKFEATSNYGDKSVDIAAPGMYIYTTIPKNRCDYASGTSFATAMVSGVALNIYIKSERMSAGQCKRLICDSCRKISELKKKVKTGGMLDAGRVMECFEQRYE